MDYSYDVMTYYGRKDDLKYQLSHKQLMLEMLENKGELDVIDWLVLGNHYSKSAEEEVAYQCYYMAHLLNHEKIEANSKL